MTELERKRKFPIAFWICGCTEIFERLSFYLGRSLILVFVTIADTTGAKMQADLTAYSYLAGFLGAFITDKLVGARYTTPVGMLIIALGYFSGSMAHDAKLVYVMVFCVAFGLGLFKTGPLIGRVVKPEDLNSAYSIRYSLVNVGAFFGPLVAGFLYQYTFKSGDILGFRPCFRLAAISMLLGCIWFTVGMLLKGKDYGKKPFKMYKTEEELKREAEEKAAAKAKAEELIQKLKDGADFSELAKENSADTGTASKGGEIGPFKRSDMVKEFSEASYNLKNVGDITETPVETQFGYHIIKMLDKGEKKPFDEVKSQMEEEMLQAKLKDSAYLHQTMVDLLKGADVKISDESLQNALKNFLDAADSTTTSSK